MAADIFFPAPITIETDLQGVTRNEAMSLTPKGAASTSALKDGLLHRFEKLIRHDGSASSAFWPSGITRASSLIESCADGTSLWKKRASLPQAGRDVTWNEEARERACMISSGRAQVHCAGCYS
jgi:hypothetical protein